MGKEVTHAARFDDPRQPNIPGPTRELLVLSCNDGSLYEFQRLSDSPRYSLRRRGERGDDPRDFSDSRARLPSDVIDTLNEIVGVDSWNK